MDAQMMQFLASRPVAVVGASSNREKYGNIILRNLRDRGWEVYAVNPREREIEGQPAYASLAECPSRPELAVMVVPPPVTLKALDEAHALGIERIWVQPGAGSPEVAARARELGLGLIDDACIMVMASRLGAWDKKENTAG